MAYNNRDNIDYGKDAIPKLFKSIFIPTVLGMICTLAFILTDGIFVGHGIGPDGLAGVNLVAPIMMLITGLGMMFAIGSSVVAAIHLANNNEKAARIDVTQAFIASIILSMIVVLLLYIFQDSVLKILGTSDRLMDMTREYYVWFIPTCILIMLQIIGEFVIRLDGSPKYAMLANMIPAAVNIILDYVFIFPCRLGLLGAALATDIGTAVGAGMTIFYMARKARHLRFRRFDTNSIDLFPNAKNVIYMMTVGFSGFLSELTMSVIAISGNHAFKKNIGDSGIAAFSIICYLLPVVANIYYSVSSSAQPIISYNYGADKTDRVNSTFRYSVRVCLLFSMVATLICWICTSPIISMFLESDKEAYQLALNGLPLFSLAFMFMAFNSSSIGYFQSTEKNKKSSILISLKGILFPTLSFSVLPILFGEIGLWLAVPCSEALTMFFALCFLYRTPLNRKLIE